MKLKILIPLIIIELLFVSFIGYKIFHKVHEKKVLQASVMVLDKEDFPIEKIDGLEYFYEPKPNTIQQVNIPHTVKLGYPENERIKYNINSHGFNQLTDFPEEKPSNVFRIMAIGDSFTFGAYVNTKDNYPSQLQEILNKTCTSGKEFQVVNLGVGGYDFQYTVERYKLRGQAYHPDLILWLIIQADFLRNRELQTPKLNEVNEEMRQNGEDQVAWNKGDFNLSWNKANEMVSKSLGGDDNVLQLQQKYLYSISDFYSGNLVLSTLPMSSDYNNILDVFKTSRKMTFHFKDIPPIWSINDAQLPDGHPTAKGHQLIAQSLFQYLLDKHLIPCK